MLYKIISAPLSELLVDKVQEKLNKGWILHGTMTHILYKDDVEFYQPMTKIT